MEFDPGKDLQFHFKNMIPFMTKHLNFVTLLLGMSLLFSCKNSEKKDPQQPDEPKGEPIRFEMQSFTKKGGTCKEDHVKCVVIKLNYPLAVAGVEQARNSINQFVNRMSLEAVHPDPDQSIKDIDTAAEKLIGYYQEQLNDFPDYELGWEIDVDGNAEIVDNYAVITLSAYSNTGGAHPNHHISIANFNLNSGKELKLREIITDAKAFNELAQKRFIEARISEYDLDEVDINDFFFGEGFQLPENFALKKEGIFFYYNPYEAAPYALGTTEFTIAYKDLKDIVKL